MTTTASSSYTDMRGCALAAAELVEHLADIEIHALILGGGEVVVDVADAATGERVAATLGLVRETWWLQLNLGQPFGLQWRGTWRGVEVVLRAYSPRSLRAHLRDIFGGRSAKTEVVSLLLVAAVIGAVGLATASTPLGLICGAVVGAAWLLRNFAREVGTS